MNQTIELAHLEYLRKSLDALKSSQFRNGNSFLNNSLDVVASRTRQILTVIPANLYTYFIPHQYNNGHPIEPDKLARAEHQIAYLGGGLTKYPTSEGLWITPTGLRKREPIIPIQTATPINIDTQIIQAGSQLTQMLRQNELLILKQPICKMVIGGIIAP